MWINCARPKTSNYCTNGACAINISDGGLLKKFYVLESTDLKFAANLNIIIT